MQILRSLTFSGKICDKINLKFIKAYTAIARFPHGNKELLKKWIQAMRREDWQPSRSDRICEKHFLPSDYQYPQDLPYSRTLSRRYLKRGALPSVFNFPEHLNKKHCPRQPPKKRSSDGQVPSSRKPSKVPKQHHDDHPYSSKLLPRKLKARYEKKLKQKNKTVKNLRKKM